MGVYKILVKDVFETYSYVYINEKTKHGILIDPGAEAHKILSIIYTNHWKIDKVLLTHGHFDHTGAVQTICETLKIPYYIHENGKEYLEDTHMNLSKYCDRNIVLHNAHYFKEGDCFQSLQVLHTPGHTKDSVIFYSKDEGIAFVGDTMYGNTSYPGGNQRQFYDTIMNKIFTLPEKTILYSGHSMPTTIQEEKRRYKL